jgi:ProP effector
MTFAQTVARDLAADAVLTLLAETWPTRFVVHEKRRRPVQLGIHHSILAALDGAVTPQELRRALRYYIGNTWYLRAIVAGAARIDLEGNPAGAVTAEEAAAAAARLASHKRKRRRVSSTAPYTGARTDTTTCTQANRSR